MLTCPSPSLDPDSCDKALVELFNPDLFFPAHHDELLTSLDGKSLLDLPDMATELWREVGDGVTG